MRTLATIALATLTALASACGGGAKELQYGPALAPTLDEQAAADGAQATFQGSLTFAPSTEPTTGAPGLADQIAASLGGVAPTAGLPAPAAAQARRALTQAARLPFATVPVDPACTVLTETRLTWSGCVATVSEVDPVTGDATEMTVRIDGHLDWVPATGVLSWDVAETVRMDLTFDLETMRIDATARLQGSFTFGPTTIRGQSSSAVASTVFYQGLSASDAVTTTAQADLTYAPDPFCITGGTLTVEQLWRRRPMGMTPADLPDLGWRFVWTGCGVVTVAHGG